MKVKKGWIVIGLLVLIITLLNPGMKRFQEYSGVQDDNLQYVRKKV